MPGRHSRGNRDRTRLDDPNNLRYGFLKTIFLVLFPIFLSYLFLKWFFPEEPSEMPEACENFTVVLGALKGAWVVVFGERHEEGQQTINCLLALAGMYFNDLFDVYYEGALHFDRGQRFGWKYMPQLEGKASSLKSWDYEKFYLEVGQVRDVSFYMLAIIKLAEMRFKSSLDDPTMYAVLKVLTPEIPEFNRLLMGLPKEEMEAFTPIMSSAITYLISEYETSKYSSFDEIVDHYFVILRRNLPSLCDQYSNDRLWQCFARVFSQKPDAARNEGLLKHIKGVLSGHNKRTFFVAGKSHLNGITDRLRKLSGVAALSFKHG